MVALIDGGKSDGGGATGQRPFTPKGPHMIKKKSKPGGKSKGSPKGKRPGAKSQMKAVMQKACLRCGRRDHVAANCPMIFFATSASETLSVAGH